MEITIEKKYTCVEDVRKFLNKNIPAETKVKLSGFEALCECLRFYLINVNYYMKEVNIDLKKNHRENIISKKGLFYFMNSVLYFTDEESRLISRFAMIIFNYYDPEPLM